jgi:hypothetical protein
MTVPLQAVKSYSATTTIAATRQGVSKSSLIVAIAGYALTTETVSGVSVGSTALSLAEGSYYDYAGYYEGAYIYYASDIPAGLTTVSVSSSGINFSSGEGGIAIYEIPGTIVLDKAPSLGTGVGTSYASGATGTLSQSSEFVVGVVAGNINYKTTQGGTGWTHIVASNSECWSAGYKNVTDGSSQQYTGTLSGSFNWISAIASFEVTPPPPFVTGFMALFI